MLRLPSISPTVCALFRWYKSAIESVSAYFRYTLDINLTDEQVNHTLMREAEGIVAGRIFLRMRDIFINVTLRPCRLDQ